MKRIVCALAVFAAFTSCNFVKVDGKSLSSVLNSIDSPAEIIEASDNYITKTFNVADFDGIVCNVPCNIIYSMDATGVTVDGPDNVIENLMIFTEDRTLNIKYDKYRFRNLKKLDIYVSSRTLQRLNVNGAVDFKAMKGVGADNFEAEINGAADMEISGLIAGRISIEVNGAADAEIKGLKCDSIAVTINGAGDCSLSGTAGKADLNINGAGEIDIKHLVAETVNSSIHGVGSIERK